MTSRRGGYKAVLASVWVACLLLLAAGLVSAQEPSTLDTLRDRCDGRIEELQGKVDSGRMVGAIVAALGAVAAAIAGFATKHEGWRKPSAVVAVLAAALPMVPRMLPDESRLETELARSGRHQLAGIKAEAQLEDFVFEDTRREYRKYVKARFVECASRDATEAVPDFPKVEVASELAIQGHAQTSGNLEQAEDMVEPEPSERAAIKGARNRSERAATMGAPVDDPRPAEQAAHADRQRAHERAQLKPPPDEADHESAAKRPELALDGDKIATPGIAERTSKHALGANAKGAASAATQAAAP